MNISILGTGNMASGLAVPFATGGHHAPAAKAREMEALASARYLEPVGGLNIALAYGLCHGTDIAPTWQRAA